MVETYPVQARQGALSLLHSRLGRAFCLADQIVTGLVEAPWIGESLSSITFDRV
jgi:hypothetical protein